MNYDELLAPAAKAMRPSGIRKFFDLAADMPHCISLGVGEPDFKTPWSVRDAGIRSLELGRTKYTANSGLKELRGEICNYLQRRFDLHYKEENVLVTVGGSEAIDIALRALIDPGDEVITMNPSYVAYTPGITLAGGVCVPVELKHEEDFKLLPEALEAAISEKSKVLLINFPSNPTGGVMDHDDYAKLVPIIRKHNLIVISDEIYAELTYDGKFASLAQFDEIKDQVIVINGFSKAFAMTGWRLGYILANPQLIQAMNKIHQYVIMSAPTAAQYGAIEGLKKGIPHVEEMVESYRARRNFIVSGFNRIGLQCHLPHGAFYVFPDIRKTGLSSDAFCELLLKEEKVACVPGTAFGEAGEGFVRVSYAYSIDHIREALARIEHFLNKNHFR